MKFLLLSILILGGIIGTLNLSLPVEAAEDNYVLLEPEIIGQTTGSSADFGTYATKLFKQAFVIAVSLAIFMLILSGVYYIVSYAPSALSEAKSMATNALWGLAIAICAYAFLYTINPDLVNLSFDLQRVKPTTPPVFNQPGTGGGGGGTTNPIPINAVSTDFNGVAKDIFDQVDKIDDITDPAQRETAIRSDILTSNNIGVNHPCPQTCVGGWTNETVWVVNGVNLGLQDAGVANGALIISGGSENHSHSAGSSHYDGRAIDIRNDSNGAGNTFYRDYQSLSQNDFRDRYGFSRNSISVLNEGDHIHIETLTDRVRNDINSFQSN